MFLGKMAWLADWSHLRGIPRVSAWVGSRRWARLLAWWVFPFVSWGLLVLSLSLLAMGLLSFRASSALSYRSFLRDDTSLCRFYYFSCFVLQHNLGASNYYVFFSP